MSYAERTSPEILLLEKLEEVDKALPPALWEQMRADVGMAESLERADKTMLPAVRQRKRMFLRDFVEKAVSMPLKIIRTFRRKPNASSTGFTCSAVSAPFTAPKCAAIRFSLVLKRCAR